MDDKKVTIFAQTTDLFHYSAQDFMQRAIAAVKEKGNFTVALSGGNTPKPFFTLLASDPYKDSIPWSHIQFFFGDERYVPAENEQSNYHMAHTFLFTKVSVNKKNIYRMKTEFINPDDASQDYEATLREFFKISENAIPKFDLIYLGIGENAHTASLMPKSDLVKAIVENTIPPFQLVASLYVESLEMYRLTLTPKVLNNASTIIFLDKGDKKSQAIKEVLEGKYDPILYPAQLIKCKHSPTLWYLDQEAAHKLKI